MSIPSREATQPIGRCKPKTGASSSRKEFAPFRANSSLQSATPLEIVTVLWTTTGSHTSIFLSPEEAQPSPSLRPLQPRTKSNMSPRGEKRGPTDHEPTASRKSCKNVMLCYVMLCYVMLCYVMLCYVMLCYVMLCYVMLCYVIGII